MSLNQCEVFNRCCTIPVCGRGGVRRNASVDVSSKLTAEAVGTAALGAGTVPAWSPATLTRVLQSLRWFCGWILERGGGTINRARPPRPPSTVNPPRCRILEVTLHVVLVQAEVGTATGRDAALMTCLDRGFDGDAGAWHVQRSAKAPLEAAPPIVFSDVFCTLDHGSNNAFDTQ